MGMLLLLIAAVGEVAFAAYCIVTKSNQKQVGSVISIGALAAFVLFTLVSVIAWGFRWYGLAALLLVRATLGAWTLLRPKEPNRAGGQEKGYKAGRIAVRASAMLALVAIALIPALVFPVHEHIATTGAHTVATARYTYVDENRVETYIDTGEHRKLNVEFWYPQDDDAAALHTYPLVVFSHGAFGVKSSNESLFNELASYGYVVASIDHTYQALFTTDADGHTTGIDRGYMQEILTDDPHADKPQSDALFQEWMKVRTGDIDFVIDHSLAEASKDKADTVYKLIDAARIGVMGHSLGGAAALGIGRMRDDIGAVVALESPFMNDITGVKDGEFVFSAAIYPVPVLNVYSDASWSHLCEWAQYAENCALLSATTATAFDVDIHGVRHLTLTDLALTSPFLTRVLHGQRSTTGTDYCLKTINKVVLEFFDAYLKGKGGFTGAGTY